MGAAPPPEDIVATVLFALAILHTFSTKYFEHLAHRSRSHGGLWRLLGEVEVVFGFWSLLLVLFLAFTRGIDDSVKYVEARSFTEPAFVFAVMVIAATRPILHAAQGAMVGAARLLPLNSDVAQYAVFLSLGPLLGSLITEPASMTLTALLLRDRFFARGLSAKLKYATLGVLFVNVSIGGALTPYAAPPIVMVAGTWGWDLGHVFQLFGWRAVAAVLINAAVVTFLFRRELAGLPANGPKHSGNGHNGPPLPLIVVHFAFLAGVVFFAHHPLIFIGLLLFFLGFVQAYRHHQTPLLLREGLMVGFFLAGLVILGAKQQWWLEPALAGMSDTVLYFGATALTAITDNAALTYLGSLVPNVSDGFKYSLVAGAITGGGLTVIANAPNPAGYAILKGHFEDEAISALGLLVAALPPTLVAIVCFQIGKLG